MVKKFAFIDKLYNPTRNDLVCLFRAKNQLLLQLDGSLLGWLSFAGKAHFVDGSASLENWLFENDGLKKWGCFN